MNLQAVAPARTTGEILQTTGLVDPGQNLRDQENGNVAVPRPDREAGRGQVRTRRGIDLETSKLEMRVMGVTKEKIGAAAVEDAVGVAGADPSGVQNPRLCAGVDIGGRTTLPTGEIYSQAANHPKHTQTPLEVLPHPARQGVQPLSTTKTRPTTAQVRGHVPRLHHPRRTD